MGCRACVQDSTRYVLFGSNRLCPDCALLFDRIRPRRRSRPFLPQLIIILTALVVSALLMLALFHFRSAKLAEWEECAQKINGPIGRVVAACGARPGPLALWLTPTAVSVEKRVPIHSPTALLRRS